MYIPKKHRILTFLLVILYSISSCTKDEQFVDKPVNNELNISDPLYSYQWYLKNTGQTFTFNHPISGTIEEKITPGIDINIEPVWKKGYFGNNVYVGILDNHVDNKHEDLNLIDQIIYNSDGMGFKITHGTKVAGVIGAIHNNLGVRGIAPKANLISYEVTTGMDYVVQALNSKYKNDIAVYNNSWGKKIEYVYSNIIPEIKRSFETGSKDGFFGKGSSFVFAAGNGSHPWRGSNGGSSNDPNLNDYRIIGVNAISHTGEVNPDGSQMGTNIFIVAPGRLIMTTTKMGYGEESSNYYKDFGRTSAAAPQVTGIIALIRGARPDLTWRDIKLILAESAKKVGSFSTDYQITGKMYSDSNAEQKHSMVFGFGLVDANAALELALKWNPLPALKIKTYTFDDINKTYGKMGTKDKYLELALNTEGSNINYIESISIEIDFTASTKKKFHVRMDMRLITPNNRTITFFDENRGTLHRFASFLEGADRLELLSYQTVGSKDIRGTYRLKINQSNPRFVKDENKGTIDLIKNVKIIVRGH